MKLLNQYRAWRDRRAVAKAVRKDALARQIDVAQEINRRAGAAVERSKLNIQARVATSQEPEVLEVRRYTPPPGVVPAEAVKMAMDWDCTDYAYLNQNALASWAAGGFFKGYPYYANLATQTEYRKITETIAEEMTRKWIKLKSKGGKDKSDAIEKLTKALDKFKVRDHFRTMAIYDGFYGRGQLYIDVKTPRGVQASMDEVERKTILVRSSAKITKGSLIGFKAVEPYWTYPGRYNSDKPLAADFYRPMSWYVMGAEIHATRLITFISRPVPDILKPSYNFGGLSMSQLAEPYVNNWLRTRDSVSDLIHSFSLSGIATELGTILQDGGGAEQMMLRAALYNDTRDTRGLMLIDKNTEEFFQFNTPLSSLDKLQAQAQEQMATPAAIPLVKFFGITPAGLNASSDGEIQIFQDGIHARQESSWRDPLQAVIEIIQLSEFGAIDEDITFDFESLEDPDAVEQATVRKTDADTDAVLITANVITPDESRERLIADPSSPYHSLESNPDPQTIDEVMSNAEESRSAELLAQTQPPDPKADNAS